MTEPWAEHLRIVQGICDSLVDLDVIKKPKPKGLVWLEEFIAACEMRAAAVEMIRDLDVKLAPHHSTDWSGWAVPAIQEVLAEHVMTWHVGRIECWSEDGSHDCGQWFQDQQEWREHVAPLISKRIGCDPSRAIRALQDYRPDKVRP